jgi:PAS domain S-box-containing protein
MDSQPSGTWTPGAIAALRQRHDLPFVRTNSEGVIIEFNTRFSEVYGWDQALMGESIAEILPTEFRDLHHAGFARFQLTEKSKVVNHPLILATITKSGEKIKSEHYIVAEKIGEGVWSFAATLRPLEGEHAI